MTIRTGPDQEDRADEQLSKLSKRRFPVIELFGPTIQGEGPDAGQPCYFVRFGGCDYRCGYSNHAEANRGGEPDGAFVCDSLHAVLPSEVRKRSTLLTAYEIADRLEARAGSFGPRYVVFSGGNPALLELDLLVIELHRLGWTIAVETQGSTWKDWLAKIDRVVISPKPPSSKQPFRMSDLHRMLSNLSKKRTSIKIPIYDDEDLAFADRVFMLNGLVGHYLSITNDWRKSETTDELLARTRFVIERAQYRPHTAKARVLPQIHVLLWGNERER